MTPDTTQLQQLEKLLIERREHFISLNENTTTHCDDVCAFMANEKLLAHYDQLIEIVRQAILIGDTLSAANRDQFIALMDRTNTSLEQVEEIPEHIPPTPKVKKT